MKILTCQDMGKALRAKRKEMNYTQSFLSEFTGLSVSFISDVENGKPTAELGKVLLLSQTLGLDLLVESRGDAR